MHRGEKHLPRTAPRFLHSRESARADTGNIVFHRHVETFLGSLSRSAGASQPLSDLYVSVLTDPGEEEGGRICSCKICEIHDISSCQSSTRAHFFLSAQCLGLCIARAFSNSKSLACKARLWFTILQRAEIALESIARGVYCRAWTSHSRAIGRSFISRILPIGFDRQSRPFILFHFESKIPAYT